MNARALYHYIAKGRAASLEDLLHTRSLAKQLRLPTSRLLSHTQHTGENLSRRGRGLHFEETRVYQAGDDIRHIDWRVTARTGETHTKIFREEHARPVVFLIDFHPGMYFGTRSCYKSVLAAHVAATLAFSAMDDGNPVGGLALLQQNPCIPVHHKERGVLPLLQQLSAACIEKPAPTLDLHAGLEKLRPILKTGALLVIISDFCRLSAAFEQQLTALIHQHPIWLLRTQDPLETAPPPAGRYPISNTHQWRWLDLTDSEGQIAYQRFCDIRQAALPQLAKRLGLTHLDLLTHRPILPQLAVLSHQLGRL